MPYSYEFSPDLDKQLKKLKKKDSPLHERVMKKVLDIIDKPELYKTLRHVGGRYKRVHVGPFVLIFEILEDKIYFLLFDHHDKAYKVLRE